MQQRPEKQLASSLSITVLGPAASVPLLVADCASGSVTNPRLLCSHFANKNAHRVNQTLQLADNAQVAGAPPDLSCQRHPGSDTRVARDPSLEQGGPHLRQAEVI